MQNTLKTTHHRLPDRRTASAWTAGIQHGRSSRSRSTSGLRRSGQTSAEWTFPPGTRTHKLPDSVVLRRTGLRTFIQMPSASMFELQRELQIRQETRAHHTRCPKTVPLITSQHYCHSRLLSIIIQTCLFMMTMNTCLNLNTTATNCSRRQLSYD